MIFWGSMEDREGFDFLVPGLRASVIADVGQGRTGFSLSKSRRVQRLIFGCVTTIQTGVRPRCVEMEHVALHCWRVRLLPVQERVCVLRRARVWSCSRFVEKMCVSR